MVPHLMASSETLTVTSPQPSFMGHAQRTTNNHKGRRKAFVAWEGTFSRTDSGAAVSGQFYGSFSSQA